MFPNKTNVEFAQMVGEDRIRLRVWERGCGRDAGVRHGRVCDGCGGVADVRIGREATVELPGGELDIRWAEDDHVYMTGPAERSSPARC